jgi:hypothetical protein
MISGGADEEVEVGAGIGLLYVVYIEPLPAANGTCKAREGGGVRSAALQLLSETSSVNIRSGTSRVISSPVCTNASGPPAAASGATCSTTVP